MKEFKPIIAPRATEKAYVAQTQNTYIFYVDNNMSKQAIARAIAEEFKVTVLDVRTLKRKGKATRFSRGKHAYPGTTYRADQKVAYATLKDGDKIPVFESTKEEAPKDKKADKAEEKKTVKKVAKKTEKKEDK